MTKPILLFDARNILYRAVYACGDEPQVVTVAIKLMAECVTKFKPQAACVFWDDSSRGGWRRKIFPTYKARDDHRDSARARVEEAEPVMRDLIPALGLRQFIKDDAEADDLIYAACRVLFPTRIVIISSDKDYTQIVYRNSNVVLYDHRTGKSVTQDQIDADPVVEKALDGDDSDKIPGYSGIGPVNSKRLAKSIDDLNSFLDKRGPSIYIRNRLLVDLSMCPNLMKNILYVQRAMSSKTEFNRAAIYDMARHIPRLAEEYDRAASPFKIIHEDD